MNLYIILVIILSIILIFSLGLLAILQRSRDRTIVLNGKLQGGTTFSIIFHPIDNISTNNLSYIYRTVKKPKVFKKYYIDEMNNTFANIPIDEKTRFKNPRFYGYKDMEYYVEKYYAPVNNKKMDRFLKHYLIARASYKGGIRAYINNMKKTIGIFDAKKYNNKSIITPVNRILYLTCRPSWTRSPYSKTLVAYHGSKFDPSTRLFSLITECIDVHKLNRRDSGWIGKGLYLANFDIATLYSKGLVYSFMIKYNCYSIAFPMVPSLKMLSYLTYDFRNVYCPDKRLVYLYSEMNRALYYLYKNKKSAYDYSNSGGDDSGGDDWIYDESEDDDWIYDESEDDDWIYDESEDDNWRYDELGYNGFTLIYPDDMPIGLKGQYKILVYKSAYMLYERNIKYTIQNDCIGDEFIWNWNSIMTDQYYIQQLNEIGVQFVVGYRFTPKWNLNLDVNSIRMKMDNYIGTCYEICVEKLELLNPTSIFINSKMEKHFYEVFNLNKYKRREIGNCKFTNGKWKDISYDEKFILQTLQETTEHYKKTYVYKKYDKVSGETLFGQIAKQIAELNAGQNVEEDIILYNEEEDYFFGGYSARNSSKEMSLPYEMKNEKYTKDNISLSKYEIMNNNISEEIAKKSDYESEEEKFDAYMYDKIMNYIESLPESTDDNKPNESKRPFDPKERKYWHDLAYY